MAVMQALGIIVCSAEPYLHPILVNMKKIWAKFPRVACMEINFSQVKANMVCGRKPMMMMTSVFELDQDVGVKF